MTSFGRVELSKIWRMLERCAEGYRAVEQPHKWRVEYAGRTFPDLPLGKRASKTPEIELGAWPSERAGRVLAALRRVGWEVERTRGSHRVMERSGWPDFCLGLPRRRGDRAKDAG